MFRRPDGSWKVLKSDRGRYVKILAENVKNPDEIWFDWRRDLKTGKWNLRRRYLSRFDLDGGQESCLTVFKVARTGWRQVTNFAPRAGTDKDAQDTYLRKQRRGSMIWAREEENRKPKASSPASNGAMRPQERVCAALSNSIMAKPVRNVKSDVGSIVWPPPFRESALLLRPPGTFGTGFFSVMLRRAVLSTRLVFRPAGAIGVGFGTPRPETGR